MGGIELMITAETAPLVLQSRVVAALEDVVGNQSGLFRPA